MTNTDATAELGSARATCLPDATELGVDPIVPWRQALRLMGMSASTGRRRKNDPAFPERVAIGPHRWALRASAIREWIASRPTDREIAFKGPKKPFRKKSPSPQIESADL
jgi:predicted DNA-binding transcriptional regulator AlpA